MNNHVFMCDRFNNCIPDVHREVVLSLQTLPLRANTESDWHCGMEWVRLVRLLSHCTAQQSNSHALYVSSQQFDYILIASYPGLVFRIFKAARQNSEQKAWVQSYHPDPQITCVH